jgi:transcriptional regulator with XRE-family HTH domain
MCGPEFRFLRKQMGLTQTELAELFDVSDQTIANYETRLILAQPMR